MPGHQRLSSCTDKETSRRRFIATNAKPEPDALRIQPEQIPASSRITSQPTTSRHEYDDKDRRDSYLHEVNLTLPRENLNQAKRI